MHSKVELTTNTFQLNANHLLAEQYGLHKIGSDIDAFILTLICP